MKRIGIIVIAMLAFLLLSSMAWVRISLLKPALYVYPAYIKNVAIVDRSMPDESVKSKIEEALTGEMMKQDEQAVRRVMEGMADACAGFDLYAMEKTPERLQGGGKKSVFPVPLNWDEVSALCDKYQADAILAVEIFDSDFLVANPVQVVRQAAEGAIITGGSYSVNGIAVIHFGIRLYDPASQKIIDEYQVSHRLNINAGGYTVQDAVNYVLNKVEAINQASYYAGRIYGERITPSYYTVVREFYDRPRRNDDLRIGVRKSEVADWNGAIESWTRALNDKKRKVRRRAAFNIAVAYEVLGDIEKAKEWARKAYTEYEEKRANDYYNMLVNREREEAIIRRQVPQGE
ncbi:MAG: hypothetical protein JXR41_02825 [Bacteroidales bacterium]|nr:hypothetical protein [Bacteroidales bacterium]MBN2761999.1 hypothetical protein [Bacteroidales bacterium]